MPMYCDKTNAENRISVSERTQNAMICKADGIVNALSERIGTMLGEKSHVSVAMEAWYGTPVNRLAEELIERLKENGYSVCGVDAAGLFLPEEEIRAYKQKFLTDDPGFGYVNDRGEIAELMDGDKCAELKRTLTSPQAQVSVVYGCGSTAGVDEALFDLTVFTDITREPMLWKMWDGELIPFGSSRVSEQYLWKEYYYCDFYLLQNTKNRILKRMDFYVEGIEYESLKMLPKDAYDEIMQTLVRYPIKQVKEFQPGPWGAYRYRDLFDVKGLGCNAWNRLASPELSILIEFGGADLLEVPLTSVMQYGKELCGEELDTRYPGLFPLEIWLDDGYFPEKQPAERISMPIHNHPGSRYVKTHFNEPLGRYETYYIAEAYEGANTWMGFREDADLELWENKCHESENQTEISDWKDFIANHTSNEGDLYLIPPGTVHGHGGNQMVLEMDTCPSVAGTEYSFFEYDFARPTWNDEEQTMTGKKMKMHLDHAFDNEKWRREKYVGEHLRATKHVTEWNKDFSTDEYSTLPEMPFTVGRFHFYHRAEGTTAGQYPQILTLTVGTKVKVVSKQDPTRFTVINRFQSTIVPASFGDYEIINEDGGNSTVVKFTWKETK